MNEAQRAGDRHRTDCVRISEGTPHMVFEILPLTLGLGHMVVLRRPTDTTMSSWLIPHQPGIHPNDTVLQHLAAFFGDVFEPQVSIVHSTSWRYDSHLDRIILTYLVVLPYRAWMGRAVAAARICFEYVGAIKKVEGDNLYPPERMEMDHVLAHALDHLALLSRDDMGIQAVLAPEWANVLGSRLPKPAGFFSYDSIPSSLRTMPFPQ